MKDTGLCIRVFLEGRNALAKESHDDTYVHKYELAGIDQNRVRPHLNSQCFKSVAMDV